MNFVVRSLKRIHEQVTHSDLRYFLKPFHHIFAVRHWHCEFEWGKLIVEPYANEGRNDVQARMEFPRLAIENKIGVCASYGNRWIYIIFWYLIPRVVQQPTAVENLNLIVRDMQYIIDFSMPEVNLGSKYTKTAGHV